MRLGAYLKLQGRQVNEKTHFITGDGSASYVRDYYQIALASQNAYQIGFDNLSSGYLASYSLCLLISLTKPNNVVINIQSMNAETIPVK